MARVTRLGQTVPLTGVPTSKISCMELVNTHMLTKELIRGISMKILSRDTERCNGPMEDNMKARGTTVKWRAMVSTIGQTETGMKATL